MTGTDPLFGAVGDAPTRPSQPDEALTVPYSPARAQTRTEDEDATTRPDGPVASSLETKEGALRAQRFYLPTEVLFQPVEVKEDASVMPDEVTLPIEKTASVDQVTVELTVPGERKRVGWMAAVALVATFVGVAIAGVWLLGAWKHRSTEEQPAVPSSAPPTPLSGANAAPTIAPAETVQSSPIQKNPSPIDVEPPVVRAPVDRSQASPRPGEKDAGSADSSDRKTPRLGYERPPF